MWSARERGSDEATSRCKLKIGHDLAASPLLAREAWVAALAAPPFASRVLNVEHLRVQDHVATVCDDDDAPSPRGAAPPAAAAAAAASAAAALPALTAALACVKVMQKRCKSDAKAM